MVINWEISCALPAEIAAKAFGVAVGAIVAVGIMAAGWAELAAVEATLPDGEITQPVIENEPSRITSIFLI